MKLLRRKVLRRATSNYRDIGSSLSTTYLSFKQGSSCPAGYSDSQQPCWDQKRRLARSVPSFVLHMTVSISGEALEESKEMGHLSFQKVAKLHPTCIMQPSTLPNFGFESKRPVPRLSHRTWISTAVPLQELWS